MATSHRLVASPWVRALGITVMLFANAGCDDDDSTSDPTDAGTSLDGSAQPDPDAAPKPDPDAASPPDPDGAPPPVPDLGPPDPEPGNAELTGLVEAASVVDTPFDATPDPDGEIVYFVAVAGEEHETSALWRADGETVTMLVDGFTTPMNVVTSFDGDTLFVADAGDEIEDDDEDEDVPSGVVFAVSSDGGDKAAIESTRAYEPRGLAIADEGGEEVLYFTGVDPADGEPGVFKTLPGGGAVSVKAKGAPLVEPSGIAVSAAGVVYVADVFGEDGFGTILRIADDAAQTFVAPIAVGYPAGIALAQSDLFLLVSGLDPVEGTAVVYRIDVTDGMVERFDAGISHNTESAGVHRAHNTDRFAWANADGADEEGDGGGTVYLIGTTADPLDED